MEKEYIDREAVIKTIIGQPPEPHYPEWYYRDVKEIPAADVVEVVRCKDCKHATFYSCRNDACYRAIICEYEINTDDENFFCSYGERKGA